MNRVLFTCVLLLLFSIPAHCGEQKVVLTTVEWPPYTSKSLPGLGMSSVIVREAFKAVGYDVEILVYPWKRAYDAAQNNPEVQGFFPEYLTSKRRVGFLYSKSIGESPLGLVERVSSPILWENQSDLQQYALGVVSGYLNTSELDRMIDEEVIQVDESVSDSLNLRKVLAGRIDVAVADLNLFNYLCVEDAILKDRKEELRFQSRLLVTHLLYVCLRDDYLGNKLCELFNRGLSLIDVDKIQQDYMTRLGYGS